MTDTTGYARYVGLLAIVIVIAISINTVLSTPHAATGVAPGSRLPPFALPLAVASLTGDANVATHAHEGQAGSTPACAVRNVQVLNICAAYERGPVVLALFVSASSCTRILAQLQGEISHYPGLQVAGVAIRGARAAARRAAASVNFPIGWDRDGALANIYRVAACPQITFALPGGTVFGSPLQRPPTTAQLEARIGSLYAKALALGFRPPAQ